MSALDENLDVTAQNLFDIVRPFAAKFRLGQYKVTAVQGIHENLIEIQVDSQPIGYIEVQPYNPLTSRVTAFTASEIGTGWFFSDGIPAYEEIMQRIADYIRETVKGAKMPKNNQEKQPRKPDKRADLNQWFDYYHACKETHIKYTLKDLAQDVSLAYGYVRQQHSLYKAEHEI